MTFRILNIAEARFECTFGRGCEGMCCRNGRPMVDSGESARLDAKLPEILPLLRVAARSRLLTWHELIAPWRRV